jgi:hypothetical protein
MRAVLGRLQGPSHVGVPEPLCLKPLILTWGFHKPAVPAPRGRPSAISVRGGLLHEAAEWPPGPRVFIHRSAGDNQTHTCCHVPLSFNCSVLSDPSHPDERKRDLRGTDAKGSHIRPSRPLGKTTSPPMTQRLKAGLGGPWQGPPWSFLSRHKPGQS